MVLFFVKTECNEGIRCEEKVDQFLDDHYARTICKGDILFDTCKVAIVATITVTLIIIVANSVPLKSLGKRGINTGIKCIKCITLGMQSNYTVMHNKNEARSLKS